MFVSNFGRGQDWLAGVVESQTRPLSFRVRLEDGRLVKRHMDHVRDTQSMTVSRQRMTEDIPNVGVDQRQKEESARSPTENNRPDTNASDVTEQQPTEQAETEVTRN